MSQMLRVAAVWGGEREECEGCEEGGGEECEKCEEGGGEECEEGEEKECEEGGVC